MNVCVCALICMWRVSYPFFPDSSCVCEGLSDFMSENKSAVDSCPWKVLSETMRVTGCAVLSLPPSSTLFRTASQ